MGRQGKADYNTARVYARAQAIMRATRLPVVFSASYAGIRLLAQGCVDRGNTETPAGLLIVLETSCEYSITRDQLALEVLDARSVVHGTKVAQTNQPTWHAHHKLIAGQTTYRYGAKSSKYLLGSNKTRVLSPQSTPHMCSLCTPDATNSANPTRSNRLRTMYRGHACCDVHFSTMHLLPTGRNFRPVLLHCRRS